MTQIELAHAAGMAVNSIRLYEAGKRIPGLNQRIKIADALDCSPSDLLMDSELEAFSEAWEIGYMAREEETREEIELAITEMQARKDDPLYANMIAAYHRLNADGQREAVRHVEIIAGNPIYQRTPRTESTETPPQSSADDGQGN